MTTALQEGWDMGAAADAAWVPWGEGDRARAKILGTGDGYLLAADSVLRLDPLNTL
jgi:hypothetical protein